MNKIQEYSVMMSNKNQERERERDGEKETNYELQEKKL